MQGNNEASFTRPPLQSRHLLQFELPDSVAVSVLAVCNRHLSHLVKRGVFFTNRCSHGKCNRQSENAGIRGYGGLSATFLKPHLGRSCSSTVVIRGTADYYTGTGNIIYFNEWMAMKDVNAAQAEFVGCMGVERVVQGNQCTLEPLDVGVGISPKPPPSAHEETSSQGLLRKTLGPPVQVVPGLGSCGLEMVVRARDPSHMLLPAEGRPGECGQRYIRTSGKEP